MKIFTLNGSRAALNIFAGLCIFTLIYLGFIHNSGTVAVSGEPPETVYLALVINGFGNSGDGTREFMYINVPFTGSVIPGSPHTEDETRQLLANGKEVLIHMPMEARNMKNLQFSDINIMDTYTKAEARAAMLKAIDQIRGATGISNYAGSAVMENTDLMTTVLSTAIEHDLYFVDTSDSKNTKAAGIAEELGTGFYVQDIFIDGTRDIGKIERNLRRAATVAENNGFAIAIGNIGPNGGRATAQAIMNIQSELAEKGVVLVTMSQLRDVIGSSR